MLVRGDGIVGRCTQHTEAFDQGFIHHPNVEAGVQSLEKEEIEYLEGVFVGSKGAISL